MPEERFSGDGVQIWRPFVSYFYFFSGVSAQGLVTNFFLSLDYFLARLFEEKSRAIVVTAASASGSVQFFVRFHFSKTIKGIHLKLEILVHYQKRRR